MHCATANRHLGLSANEIGHKMRTKISPQFMHFVPKDTSRDEAMSNSEKIKPIALAVIELCLSERIKQAGKQLVSQ